MKKLLEASAEILYCDTDNLLFKYKRANGFPIETGNALGEMEHQYPNHDILEFVASGAKSYALRLKNKATGKEEFVMKSKG